MSFKEFIIIFEVLISGLAVAHLLDSLASVVIAKPKLYWNHLMYTTLALMLIVNHWWMSFHHSYELIVTNVFQFLIILSKPVIIYFLSIFLFPKEVSLKARNLKAIFKLNLRPLMVCFIGYHFVNMIHDYYIYSAGIEINENYALQNVVRGSFLIFACVVWMSKRVLLAEILGVLSFLLTVSYWMEIS
ncbi:hypothetical protein [Marinoscillum furvescens]|nr:hypothetical protein [Marinoscillum furvescens]